MIYFAFLAPLPAAEPEIDVDLLIRGGLVVDGSGQPPYRADLAVADGRIARIGDLRDREAPQVIDAAGLVVAPGFIDLLLHNDILWDRTQQEKAVRAGVTSGLAGNCGFSILDVEKNLSKLERQGHLVNVGTLVGQGTIRDWFVRENRRQPAGLSALERMKTFLGGALEAGAFGLSSGLGYEPGEWTPPEELEALASVLTRYPHAGYYTHIRNFRSNVLAAIQEAIRVSESAKVPVVIQHLLFKLPGNWDQTESGLLLLEKARADGLSVHATVYPYDFWGNEVQIPLHQLLYRKSDMVFWRYYRGNGDRDEILELIGKRLSQYGGGETIEVTKVGSKAYRSFLGKNLKELARIRRMTEEEAVLALLLENGADVKVCYHGLSEEGLLKKIRSPYVLFGSDATGNIPHPRDVGAFPRLLGTYVRDKRVIRLSEAVNRLTQQPAKLLGLKDRGLLKEGYWGDIVIFDLATIRDNASAVDPTAEPDGIETVLVNGQVVYEKRAFLGNYPGKVLRRGR